MRKFYCPNCKRTLPYDPKLIEVKCLKCNEEMFVIEEKIKGLYRLEGNDGTN